MRFLTVEPGAFRTTLFAARSAYFSAPMPEYEATVGPPREYVRTGGGSQPGDPAKAARAILDMLEAERPPLKLALGGGAVGAIREHAGAIQRDLAQWGELGRATGFDRRSARSSEVH